MAGDCPNCLATIDGVPYVRMCQTEAKEALRVRTFRPTDPPPIPDERSADSPTRRNRHVDVVVVGAGTSGTGEAERLISTGHEVVALETKNGQEVLAVYPGPEVIARCDGEIWRYHAHEVVVATGAAEIQPVVPGSHLAGVLTPGAATILGDAGVDLGTVVTAGSDVVRFEGKTRVEAVITRHADGNEVRHDCDTAVVSLGRYPRDILARMARPGEARTIGGAALRPDLPALPEAGTVCPCSEVEVADLDFVWSRGFQELELIKRATLAGTGTCQGGVCGPYLQAFVAERATASQSAFTARPLSRQMTLGEAAAGFRFPPVHRTGLDEVHRQLGARMDRIGGWWRPWKYPDPEAEYRAVREAVSLGDVSTLGKMLVRGPDAVALLEHVYPCRAADLDPGRSRYALVLAESGGVLDDGLISRLDEQTFALTFTSGGASFAEAWMRDWAHGLDAEVRIMDRTHSLGAINVTGPLASELLARAGLSEPLRFMRHAEAVVGGVLCRVFRLSFTGEVSYELHHPVSKSVPLWAELTRLGSDLGIGPHGICTLQTLRLEKGHVIVGMDTEPDSTPRRLGMEWAVRMDKPDFVGRAALERTNRLRLDRKLVGLTMDGPAPVDGTPVSFEDGGTAGYVTSAAWSPALRKVVMLAWVDLVDDAVPDTVVVDGRVAFHTPHPFYDPDGNRAKA